MIKWLSFMTHPIFLRPWLAAMLYGFVFLYALLFLLDQSLFKAAVKVFPLVVFVAVFWFAKYYFRTAAFFLVVYAVFTPLLAWFFMAQDYPEIAFSSPNVKPVLDNFLFVPMALVLLGDKVKTYLFWVLAGLSSFLVPWVGGDGLLEWERLLNGVRTGFGGHIITMGMVYAVVLMGLLVFCKDFFKAKKLRTLFIVAWFFFLFLSIVGVIASQSRAVYLGLFVSLAVWVVAFIFLSNKNRIERLRASLFGLCILFSLLWAGYTLGLFDSIKQRVSAEHGVYSSLLSGQINKIPKNSAGLRVHFWQEAVQWSKERPLFGWDRDISKRINKQAGNYFFKGVPFQSMHNDFLELLVTYGIFGVFLFVAVLMWVLLGLTKLQRKKRIDSNVFLFMLCFLSFFVVNGLFMSTWFFMESKFIWNIVMAGGVGYLFKSVYLEAVEPV